MTEQNKPTRKPGVCIPWEEKLKELPPISGDKQLIQQTWEQSDTLGYIYVWYCLLAW
jgi:hypothetical protein